MHQALYTLLLLCILTTLSACGGGTRAAAPDSPGRWANPGSPAARYCAEAGGRLEIRQEPAGDAGYCHLPDGSVLEEWKLHQGRNTL